MVPDTFSVPKFVLCVRNDDCDDLELRKVYEVLEDTAAAKEGYLRIVDDSSEDYVYPEQYFVRIALPLATGKAFAVSGGPERVVVINAKPDEPLT